MNAKIAVAEYTQEQHVQDTMNAEIVIADYTNKQHAQDIVFLLNHYAVDPAGGGVELDRYTRSNLTEELAKLPFAFSLICYVDRVAVGLANCFTLFSTFQCKPVINIHDLIVVDRYRRQGISQLLLNEVEQIAKDKGACKITLEVLEKNYAAKNSYGKFGFVKYELNPEYGNAIFLEKKLPW
ncbi:N-acetyltransferase [Myxosarcina sp. GI1]|uniref:GNAT family N-acetyltransferase n=1 Tax=Myxosarcina sp. GI1 TaxID=1541065 RepID=UPI001C112596|nr:GNAT family N-acetyltransferase [Myxosarcina sp. GI1]